MISYIIIALLIIIKLISTFIFFRTRRKYKKILKEITVGTLYVYDTGDIYAEFSKDIDYISKLQNVQLSIKNIKITEKTRL